MNFTAFLQKITRLHRSSCREMFRAEITQVKDISSVTVMKEIDAQIGVDAKHGFEKSGKYIVEIEFTSPLNSLAQIAISLGVDKRGESTFVGKGTEGGVGVMKANVSIMQGEHTLSFSSKADVTINKVRFLM